METLAERLLAPQRRDVVVEQAVQLIETHVHSRGGLRGISLKTGLAMLKSAKPGILPRAVQRLLPEFLDALEPLHAQFRASTERDFRRFLQRRRDDVVLALLAVADARANQASAGIQRNYGRMRGIAESEVAAVVPALAGLIGNHLDDRV